MMLVNGSATVADAAVAGAGDPTPTRIISKVLWQGYAERVAVGPCPQ
jgi:hypothetical protein